MLVLPAWRARSGTAPTTSLIGQDTTSTHQNRCVQAATSFFPLSTCSRRAMIAPSFLSMAIDAPARGTCTMLGWQRHVPALAQAGPQPSTAGRLEGTAASANLALPAPSTCSVTGALGQGAKALREAKGLDIQGLQPRAAHKQRNALHTRHTRYYRHASMPAGRPPVAQKACTPTSDTASGGRFRAWNQPTRPRAWKNGCSSALKDVSSTCASAPGVTWAPPRATGWPAACARVPPASAGVRCVPAAHLLQAHDVQASVARAAVQLRLDAGQARRPGQVLRGCKGCVVPVCAVQAVRCGLAAAHMAHGCACCTRVWVHTGSAVRACCCAHGTARAARAAAPERVPGCVLASPILPPCKLVGQQVIRDALYVGGRGLPGCWHWRCISVLLHGGVHARHSTSEEATYCGDGVGCNGCVRMRARVRRTVRACVHACVPKACEP